MGEQFQKEQIAAQKEQEKLLQKQRKPGFLEQITPLLGLIPGVGTIAGATLSGLTGMYRAKQQEKFVGNGGGPGSISFMMNGDTDYAVNMIHEAPEEGDFYMFPYNLYHFVASYSSAAKTKKERISIAANFDFVKT